MKICLITDNEWVKDSLLKYLDFDYNFTHLIGYVSQANQTDIETTEAIKKNFVPGLKVGKIGLEKSFDYELKTTRNDLKLSLDSDIQYLIREELIKFQKIFQNKVHKVQFHPFPKNYLFLIRLLSLTHQRFFSIFQ